MQEIDIVDKMIDRLYGESFIMLSEVRAWQTLKAAVLAKQTTNTASTPLSCNGCTQEDSRCHECIRNVTGDHFFDR